MTVVQGLVSTVIPVYNRARLLEEAVASVLAQTYEHIEIIIVDDGSDDPSMAGSLENCARLGHGKVDVVRQQNQGPGVARQRGLQEARGEFVQFLDSDDLLLIDKFRLQVEVLRREPPAAVSYGKTRFVLPSGEVLAPWRRTGEKILQMFPSMLAQRWWGTSTPLYRRSILDAAGPITSLVNEEDWEFDCRIAALGVQLAWVDEWVSEQRVTAENRASEGGSTDPVKLRDRARARHLILKSAVRAGVPPETPEFRTLIRYSFLVARQCAAVGLTAEAEKLVRHLNEVAPSGLMNLYLLSGKWIGFQRATRIAEQAHKLLRPGVRSPIS